jgi:integrase
MVVRSVLTNPDLADAIRLAEDGKTKYQEWSDVREPGLKLRVRKYKATWYLKFGAKTVTLGPASRWSVAQARAMASHVRGMLKCGLDPNPWVDARLAGASADEAVGVVLRREGKERNEWTLAELMQRYRDDHVKVGRVVRGQRRPPSANTLNDVEVLMRQQPYLAIAGRLLRELDERTLETYRNSLAQLHGGSASRKGLAYIKAALTWARKHHPAAAGLVGISGWWRDVAALHVEQVKTRAPTLADIGMTIALAEATRQFPGRSINAKVSGATIAALWLLAFTAHRREATVSVARGELIEDVRAGDGWGILYRPPHVMKGRREHVLPIPPSAMAILRPIIEEKTNSNWLFPAARLAKDGSEVHLHGSAINKLLLRLRGHDEKSRAAGVPDLLTLAGVTVPDWSPHDLRRTLSTLVEDWTTRGDAVSAAIDHEGRGAGQATQETAARGAAAITRTAYSQSQRLLLKRIAMEPWCDAVVAAVEAARPMAARIVASLSSKEAA